MDPLALVEPARVVVGHGLVDRLLELELAVLDEVGYQLEDLNSSILSKSSTKYAG